MLSVFRVLFFVAGTSSFVIVCRSASVPFLTFFLSLVSSLSVLPRSLFMPDRAFVLPLAVSQAHVFHERQAARDKRPNFVQSLCSRASFGRVTTARVSSPRDGDLSPQVRACSGTQ